MIIMFGSDPPPVKSGIEYWRYESIPAKGIIRGWKAGHLVGKHSHHLNGTKPCVELFTKGALKCGFNHELCPVSWHAWMPMIDESGDRVVVGVRRNQYPFAAEIAIGQPIEVTRGHRITLPVIVKEKNWCAGRKCGSIDPLNPALIHEWLLRLWKIPALTAWVMSNPEADVVQLLAADSRDLAKPPAEVEKVPTAEDRDAAAKKLEEMRTRFDIQRSGNGHARNGSVRMDVDVPKVIDVATLPETHPVRQRLKNRGVK